MQNKIKPLNGQLKSQSIENERLSFKIVSLGENVISLNDFEKLQSDLNIANSLIKYKNGKIEGQQLEIEQLSLIIKELHHKVTTTVQAAEKKSEQLETFFDQTISRMNKKLNKVL